MVKITEVEERSRAYRVGLRAGDVLLSINNNEVNDVLDYRFYLAEKKVEISFLRDGQTFSVIITKGEYDDIGLCFETPLMDKKHTCKNGCIFCFIDQNPKGMRESIYFKDDDSRLSFLHGNYITLTNMNDKDIERIVKMRISPINVSVHTTNPDLRVKMMKNKRAGEVLKYLSTFKDAGLSICGQIVLCKGVNDGDELLRSMRDLSELYPNLGSVSIVPAGITEHRDGLYKLEDFSRDEALCVIRAVDDFAARMLEKNGSRIFFVADEFYLKAGLPIPDGEYYEGYPQIENGVGMLRSFEDDFMMGIEDAMPTENRHTYSIATATAAYDLIKSCADKIMQKAPNLTINVYKIINNFYGKSITVTGLLTGRDIFDQLKDKPLGDALFIPENALRQSDDDFLCGMKRCELEEKLSIPVIPSPSDGYEFATMLLERM